MAKEFVETTLLDGFADGPHITVEQVGSANQGLYGPGDYVMDAGRNAEAQILTNNSIRVFDAVFVIQGRRDVIAANDYEDINIDNGAQGMNRNDIIVRRYTKDESSEIERTEYAVIKGTPTPSTATDPEVTVGNVRNGDTLHEMKLYRVKLEGLNIVAIEPLFQVLMNMNKINKYLSKLTVQKTSTQGGWVIEKYANGWCKLYIKAQVYRASKEQTVYKLPFPNGIQLKNVRVQMTPAQNGWNVANFYHNTSGQNDDNAVISEAVIIFTAKDTTALTYCFDVCVSGFLV